MIVQRDKAAVALPVLICGLVLTALWLVDHRLPAMVAPLMGSAVCWIVAGMGFKAARDEGRP